MTYAALLFFCIVLFELFLYLRIGKDAMSIIARSQEAMRVLRSPDLGDDEKESFMRRGSAEIFKATLYFAVKFALIGAVLYLLFLLVIAFMPDRKEALLESLMSLAMIVAMTVATLIYAWVRKTLTVRR